jgi:hypothetical protein
MAATNPTKIDRVNVHWMPYRSGCHFSLFEDEVCLGGVLVRADVPFGERSAEGWQERIADLEHNTDISADEARAVLPIKSVVVWDETVYHSFDTVEIRGQGGSLRFWVSTSSPSGANRPTQAQKAEAREYLRAVRDLLWT